MPQHPNAKYGYHLGQGGLLYLVVTALMFGIAQLSQANLLFWAFGLMIGALVASCVVSWLMLRKLEVQRIDPAFAVAGEPLILRYRVTSHHRTMPVFALVLHESQDAQRPVWPTAKSCDESSSRLGGTPTGWAMHIGARQTIQIEAVCRPSTRGELRLETIAVSSSFPFGIMRRWFTVRQDAAVLVYPRLMKVNRGVMTRLSTAHPQGMRRLDRPGGQEDFFGLRDYREGDSLRAIHWRRTAHTGRLVAKELTHASPPEIMIALDLRPVGTATPIPPEDIECAISLAASIVCHAHLRGHRVGLVTLGVRSQSFPLHHSLPHRTRILESLAWLDIASSSDEQPAISTTPTLIITAQRGASAAARRGAGAPAMIDIGDAESLISPADNVDQLLRTHTVPLSRRGTARREDEP